MPFIAKEAADKEIVEEDNFFEAHKLPNELLIATNNNGKFVEIQDLLNQIGIKSISARTFNIDEPDENGSTFEENSLIKAKYYAKKSNLFSIADDSGLVIHALNGKPGIHSARFALDESSQKNFDLAFQKIITLLKEKNIDAQTEEVSASFVCNLSLFDPQTNFSISFEGIIDGKLSFPARGLNGFGYDPIFIKNGQSLTFGEISSEEKDVISHRFEAFKKFNEWLMK